MAVRDVVDIKYLIPKLTFNIKPREKQKFTVKYVKYSENYENGNWITLSTSCMVDPDGTLNNSKKLEMKGLKPFTEYVIRFTDIIGNNYDYKFKTGMNVAMTDSPYYNKTLFPGQIYDWYEEGLGSIGLPDDGDCAIYFRMNGKKGQTLNAEAENWNSLLFCKPANNYLKPVDINGKWDSVTDKNDLSIMCYTPEGEYVLATPYMRYTDSGYTYCNAYYDQGGGGINLDNVIYDLGMHFAFAFIIKEDASDNQTLLYIDTSKGEAYNKIYKTKNNGCQLTFDLSFNVDHLESNFEQTINGESVSANSVIDTNKINKNQWYVIELHRTGDFDLYTMGDDGNIVNVQGTFANININQTGAPTAEPNAGKYKFSYDETAIQSAMYFGNTETNGVGIAFWIPAPTVNDTAPYYKKILTPNSFLPRLKLSGTNEKGVEWEYLQDTKFNTVINDEKASFLIDPDICTTVEALKDSTYLNTGTIHAEMVSNGLPMFTKDFPGFSYPNTQTGEIVHVGGLIPNASYQQDSFDITFSEAEDPLKALQQYFFTKHGTWGGYNGGVNGHNIYFDADQNLILENHGDYYKGSLMGVGKESDIKPYCGYGGDVDYDNNAFDQRTNKGCLRTGTALVSNKYFGYGRIDTWLQLPVGIWGVCPAIWLFHYIEIPETEYRYKLLPYSERNKQGNDDNGRYLVVNNEIDIELPSHLTNGTINQWSDLRNAYFDPVCMDDKLAIGVTGEDYDEENGLFQIVDIENPKERASWKQINTVANPRYKPSFQNCKLNNWVGELNSGDGWCLPQGSVTAEQYYKGTGSDLQNQKEEYCSRLTHCADNEHGYADGKYHKWSIVWLPDRILLYVDDILYRENDGFIPFNQMKLTIAGWFPTMPKNRKKEPTGVVDTDGIHTMKGGLLTNINDSPDTSIGTWAGTQADFDVLHMKVSRVKYERYHAGETIDIAGKKTLIESEPSALGESFPESGLRMFVK